MFELDPYKKKKQRETGRAGVERSFVNACKSKGWACYKFTSEMNRGVSDRIVFTPGQVWFVEIKRENGRLTELQNKFKGIVRFYGLNHFIVKGRDGIHKFIRRVENG